MQVVVLSKPGWHADELCRALAERGHTGRVLPYEGLTATLGASNSLSNGQTAILDADAVLARFIPSGSLDQLIYRLDALHWIEEHGVPVINPARAIERSVDKFYTDARLREAGLPTPDTVVCERIDDATASIRAMLERTPPDGGERAVVIKPIFGSMGHGIVRVTDPDVAFRVLQSLDQIRAVFYIQRAIASGGRDVRVFVVGGRVIGAIERRASGGDWRTNVSRGGSAGAGAPRGGRDRRRLRGRRSPAVERRRRVRARSERDSRLAGLAAGDGDRCGGNRHRSPGGSRPNAAL
jgi:RimK family alpha-L-glutamate ligase